MFRVLSNWDRGAGRALCAPCRWPRSDRGARDSYTVGSRVCHTMTRLPQPYLQTEDEAVGREEWVRLSEGGPFSL